jgi:hypothetical protein
MGKLKCYYLSHVRANLQSIKEITLPGGIHLNRPLGRQATV